jgi:nucleotidyltransferase substrate binding protein (TIGR01987 family)
MTLDPSPLGRAVARLDEALAVYRRDPSQDLIRDGLVQRFEFTYEIAHKLIKRYLEQASASPAQFDAMPFQDLIRSANEQGLLLGDWRRWRLYRDMRARTSHTYDEAVALQVVAGIPEFLAEARHLCDELERRLGQ